MTDSPDAAHVADEVLETLRLLLTDDEATAAARVAAGKILLERFAPKKDEEASAREKEEREAAIAEAKGIMAEFAAAKSEQLSVAAPLDETGAAAASNAGG